MAYQKQTFIDGETVLTADHLNHIEEGIIVAEQATGIVLLWENANPTSIFLPQTIELDLSKYQYCLIEFLAYANNTISHSEMCTVGNKMRAALPIDAGRATNANARNLTTSTTGVVVENGQKFTGSDFVTENTYMLPYKIFGIK